MKRFAVVLAISVICLFTSSEVMLAQHHEMSSDSSHEHHNKKESTATKANTASTSALRVTDASVAASVKDLVDRYLDLKNALANDKTKEAATAGAALESAFKKFDKEGLTEAQRKLYVDVADDAREQAEHIGDNAGKIEHQREHFVMLSKDMYDLVTAFGTERVLYKDFCPMYDNKKGAMWLSETKTIKNPYYGKKMLTCGSVQEEMK
ncbi:MAG: DUF3347 domain-containing protein [Bacteroidota bacterium]